MLSVESFRRAFLTPLILVALAQVVLLPLAFGQSNVPKSATSGSSKQTTGKDAGLQEVIAEGAGASPSEALKDAFRNAVRQVVGTVVDAETLVMNDEIVDDKVLTFSDGFIKTYDKVAGSEKQAGGIHRVKIKAKVERRSVMAKLKAANVTIKEVDGKGLFAEAITKLEAEKNASELLSDALDGFPANVIKVTAMGLPKLVDKTAEKATVSFDVQVTADMEKYDALQKRLGEILRKVALRKGRCLLETQEVSKQDVSFNRESPLAPLAHIRDDKLAEYRKKPTFEPLRGSQTKNGDDDFGNAWWTKAFNPKNEMVVVLCLGRGKLREKSNWEWFHIAKVDSLRSEVKVSVSLADANGREVASDVFRLVNHPGITITDRISDKHGSSHSSEVVIVSPHWILHGHYASRYVQLSETMNTTRAVSLALDDLKAVQAITCSVENYETPSKSK